MESKDIARVCFYCGQGEDNTTRLYVDWVGESRVRYVCRPCNTKKCQKYRHTKNGKKRVYAAVYKSIKKLRHKHRARNTLNRAVARGQIQKKPCRICKNEKSEAHHPDYNKPLDVVWFCRPHHASVHRAVDKKVAPVVLVV